MNNGKIKNLGKIKFSLNDIIGERTLYKKIYVTFLLHPWKLQLRRGD